MKKKNFIILSLILVIIVAGAVSYLTISLQRQALFGPAQEGTLNVALAGDLINIIIVDSSVKADVSDTVAFSNVVRTVEYTTSTANDAAGGAPPPPRPFLIRNDGSVTSDLSVSYSGTSLFSSPSSYVKYWFENPTNYQNEGVLVQFDDCTLSQSGECYSIGFNYINEGYGCISTSKCDLQATNSLADVGALFPDDNTDEVQMHIAIKAATEETTTPKSTIVVVTGTQSVLI